MARTSLLLSLLVSFLITLSSFQVQAQDAPLFVQGGLEDATVTDDTYNSGGSITVNGFNIQIPKNMLVQFPAAWVPWKEFVAEKQSMLGYEINVWHLPQPPTTIVNCDRSWETSSTVVRLPLRSSLTSSSKDSPVASLNRSTSPRAAYRSPTDQKCASVIPMESSLLETR